MNKNRLVSKDEYLDRYGYGTTLQKKWKIPALPRIFDYHSNGEICIIRGKPKEETIRLCVTSFCDMADKDDLTKREEEVLAQTTLDISFENAKELVNHLQTLLKRYNKGVKK